MTHDPMAATATPATTTTTISAAPTGTSLHAESTRAGVHRQGAKVTHAGRCATHSSSAGHCPAHSAVTMSYQSCVAEPSGG